MLDENKHAKSLKRLSKDVLGVDIQHGSHSSVEDSRATLALYWVHAHEWENFVKQSNGPYDSRLKKWRKSLGSK